MDLSIKSHFPAFKGPGGSLAISEGDPLARQLAMLVLGERSDWGVSAVAAQFDYSRQR